MTVESVPPPDGGSPRDARAIKSLGWSFCAYAGIQVLFSVQGILVYYLFEVVLEDYETYLTFVSVLLGIVVTGEFALVLLLARAARATGHPRYSRGLLWISLGWLTYLVMARGNQIYVMVSYLAAGPGSTFGTVDFAYFLTYPLLAIFRNACWMVGLGTFLWDALPRVRVARACVLAGYLFAIAYLVFEWIYNLNFYVLEAWDHTNAPRTVGQAVLFLHVASGFVIAAGLVILGLAVVKHPEKTVPLSHDEPARAPPVVPAPQDSPIRQRPRLVWVLVALTLLQGVTLIASGAATEQLVHDLISRYVQIPPDQLDLLDISIGISILLGIGHVVLALGYLVGNRWAWRGGFALALLGLATVGFVMAVTGQDFLPGLTLLTQEIVMDLVSYALLLVTLTRREITDYFLSNPKHDLSVASKDRPPLEEDLG